MPELPEVENVVRGLQPLLAGRPALTQVLLRRKNLRVPFTQGLSKKLKAQKIISVQRRAKFILFETEKYWLISHLGMTGSWREERDVQKHDHCSLEFDSGLKLVFNDPRRFGILILELKSKLQKNKWLNKLGLEPLDGEFTGPWLYGKIRTRRAPIKSVIMDQQLVVGVGNIYASEALFLAGIRPQRMASQITKRECDLLTKTIRRILRKAIDHGGSTINSYRNAEGKSGNFQNLLRVYGREGELCVICDEEISSAVIGGRSTFWCSYCQK